jgi:TonB family protein
MTSWWLGNLAEYSLQVVLLVAVGGLLPAVLRLREPRIRLVYWQVLLACCLLLPFVQPWHVPGPATLPTLFNFEASVTAAATGHGGSLGFWIGAVLGVGAVARLLWLGVGMIRLARLRTTAKHMDGVPVEAGRDTQFCVTPHVDGPVTFGWLRPAVLLPESFPLAQPDTQTAVLMHELVHIERRDWLWTVAEEVVRSALWFHPAIRWVISRIQLAREQVVDREVVKRTGGREAYLRALVEITKARVAPALSAAPAFLRKRHLKARVQTLLEDVSMTKFRMMVSLGGMTLLLIAAGLVAVSHFPLSAAPQESEKVERVGNGTSAPRLVARAEPTYTQEARDADVEGTVVLKLEVWPDGKAHNVEVIRGLGYGLDEEATKTVQLWEFEPGIKDGKAVRVAATVEMNFRL